MNYTSYSATTVFMHSINLQFTDKMRFKDTYMFWHNESSYFLARFLFILEDLFQVNLFCHKSYRLQGLINPNILETSIGVDNMSRANFLTNRVIKLSTHLTNIFFTKGRTTHV
jgi:hypothetical protein